MIKVKQYLGTTLTYILLVSLLSLQIYTVYEISSFKKIETVYICSDCSERKIITLEDAERLVRSKFKDLNKIDLIINDLKYALKFEDGELETVQTKTYTYTENSYLFLLMVSIAYNESTFRPNAVGAVGELSAFQIRPSTAKYLLKIHDFPIQINAKQIRSELKNNKIATLLAIKYVRNHFSPDNVIRSLSKYNGDKSLKYGKKIKNTFDKIVRGSYV